MEGRLQQILIIFCLVACAAPDKQKPLPFDSQVLQNGDLIYRYGNGFFSSYFQGVSDSVKTYSHVGIVHKEGEAIFVIHSEASELTGVGFVQRQPLVEWLAEVLDWGIYRLDRPQVQRDEIVRLAMIQHTKKTPFDLDFSNATDEAMYCTELIAKCINRALGEELIQPHARLMGAEFYSVDDTFLVDDIFLICASDGRL